MCNLVGIFVFFVTVPFHGTHTIPLDVFCQLAAVLVGPAQRWLVLGVCVAGALLPFAKKNWNRSATSTIFTLFKLFGAACAAMYLFGFGPKGSLLPFLFSLGQSLTFLVPIGSIFLAFLTNYGLMEFVGVFVRPLMRRIWKTPGRSAIDAVASFVGSYSVALLITDELYTKGAYTKKEAAIIATGFSTVSSTFMITVASTLGLMDRWNLYFWSTLLITFIVTAVTVRMYPLNRFPDEYREGVQPQPECPVTERRIHTALDTALAAAEQIGMLLAMYTPLFRIIGYLFYPFAALVQLPEALPAAQALATSIAEMYLPCAFVMDCSLATRYVVAVGCISELLFFSAVIPCILSTSIPVKVPQMLFIWVERVILSVLLAGAAALILF